jgi:hypothetical protein
LPFREANLPKGGGKTRSIRAYGVSNEGLIALKALRDDRHKSFDRIVLTNGKKYAKPSTILVPELHPAVLVKITRTDQIVGFTLGITLGIIAGGAAAGSKYLPVFL